MSLEIIWQVCSRCVNPEKCVDQKKCDEENYYKFTIPEPVVVLTIDEAIALKIALERVFISREIEGAYEAVSKIVKFADEQLANRSSQST